MYSKFKQSNESPYDFLRKELSDVPGYEKFLDAMETAANIKPRDSVFWVGIFMKYHDHPTVEIDDLLRTKKHFKNLALTYLNQGDYALYRSWINNWSKLLAICHKIEPTAWQRKI